MMLCTGYFGIFIPKSIEHSFHYLNFLSPPPPNTFPLMYRNELDIKVLRYLGLQRRINCGRKFLYLSQRQCYIFQRSFKTFMFQFRTAEVSFNSLNFSFPKFKISYVIDFSCKVQ